MAEAAQRRAQHSRGGRSAAGRATGVATRQSLRCFSPPHRRAMMKAAGAVCITASSGSTGPLSSKVCCGAPTAPVLNMRRASRASTPSASPLPTPPGTPRGAAGPGAADLSVLSDRLNRLALPRSSATPATAQKSAFGRALTPPTATPAAAKVDTANCRPCLDWRPKRRLRSCFHESAGRGGDSRRFCACSLLQSGVVGMKGP